MNGVNKTSDDTTVDGQNPANTKDDDCPIVYRVSTIQSWCRILFINSMNQIRSSSCDFRCLDFCFLVLHS